ncbi:MAG TPA: hypothetical protein VEY09_00595 [Pyrinomonadaceae bacterium]|nr:hypothetical protein [Pyrinomonadaceae bacterium]
MIVRHGPGLCSDARRCEGLLRDLCGGHRREINILVGALRERVPLDLLAGRNSVPAGLLLTRLAKRLEENLALTEEASRWAVGSWALALGILTEAELHGMEGRRDEGVQPCVADKTPPARPAAVAGTRPPATHPPAHRSPLPPVGHPPAAPAQASRTPPAPRTPAPPQAANAGRPQAPPIDAAARGGRGRRGCLIGCVLILLLCLLLFVGGPFVLSTLREEQQQRSLDPSPVQTR